MVQVMFLDNYIFLNSLFIINQLIFPNHPLVIILHIIQYKLFFLDLHLNKIHQSLLVYVYINRIIMEYRVVIEYDLKILHIINLDHYDCQFNIMAHLM